MNIRARAVVFAFACSLVACTSPAPDASTTEPAEATDTPVWSAPDPAPEVAVEAVIEPTAAMLRAALANDPQAMSAAAAALGTCQAASTCPAQYASCGSWSPSTLCSSTCNNGACLCHPVWACEGEPPEPKGLDSYNAFRVCFDSGGHSCTEWQKTSYTICGC
jgi:hypothetical protein